MSSGVAGSVAARQEPAICRPSKCRTEFLRALTVDDIDIGSVITGHSWETVYSLAFNAAEAGILQ
jgi:hypothetical protein